MGARRRVVEEGFCPDTRTAPLGTHEGVRIVTPRQYLILRDESAADS
jgi:hypothetical protein